MKNKLLLFLAALIPFLGFTAEIEQTLSIIKPDAVSEHHIGEIIARFENRDLYVVAIKMTQLSKAQAEEFYSVHKNRPFFKDLVTFMISGPVLIQVLEGKDAIAKNREIMGATDPKNAAPHSIRSDFGTDIQKNAVHGSDSLENAQREIAFFFAKEDIFSLKSTQ